MEQLRTAQVLLSLPQPMDNLQTGALSQWRRSENPRRSPHLELRRKLVSAFSLGNTISATEALRRLSNLANKVEPEVQTFMTNGMASNPWYKRGL